MMQQGDFSSPYYQQYHPQPHLQNPSPSPIDPQPNSLPATYASAPPFSYNYSSSSDYPGFSSPYPPYSQNSDPVSTLPSTAPSYAQTPNFQSFNPSPQPSSPYPAFPAASVPAPEPQPPYPPPPQQPSYYPAYDQHQGAPNYGPSPPSSIPPTPAPIPNTNPSFSVPYSTSSYTQLGSSMPPHMYDNSYDGGVKFEHGVGGGGFLDDNSARYGGQGLYSGSRSDLGSDLYDKRPESATHYDRGGLRDDAGLGDGVYAYDGGRVEPYGARGTGPKSSTWSAIDDYGRSVSFPSPGKDQVTSGSAKIVRAVPKAETQQDVKNGVLKYRVKLLPEGSSQGTMDVLCQIGLDGIRMLDPNTSRTLRIYPLETVTSWEGNSSIFTFWSKSSVDIEPRRIRLQSNNYTTNTILDTVTAATVQLKEMSGRFKTSDSVKTSEQSTDRKKGLADWMNLIKPGNEEKDHWVPDDAVAKCTACGTDFGAFVRKHHCRNCGDIFCDKCTSGRIALTAEENAQPVRVCDHCMAEVTERLSSAKESASKPAVLESHEDLAKKLQEEMERNRKTSSGSKSDGSGRRMREVACPTCTVHLQVQVPSSGSETIECGVCQHPFLVNAH
ncbi:protein FREE1-like [Telopea speciosissima]|uniref:protein FREE1-like n=1 Tax=Telopea speciosissima TaxID=54955 RepID=UPI001CC50C98|nr:protein FREE1-like [Telopea speciosissima]XP_043708888.1 protein FREE1-like [Telopea speciosissima]